MRVRVNPSQIRQTRWYEYLVRFVFGGLVTVAAGLVAQKYGPVVGGLFLAFPSIFPASVTLVQKHKKKREQMKGESPEESEQSGRHSAGVAAEGAALGSFGLVAFAVVLWQTSTRLPPVLVLLLALLVWFAVAVLAWWVGQKVRASRQN